MSPSHGALSRLSPVAAAVALALLSPASFSQSAPAGTEDELDEVVVTARYREENLQSTPLAISAFSAEDLEARSVTNVSDLGSTVPNAFVRQQASNFGPTQAVGMRGIIQGDLSFSFEPAVGIYIDDIYHGTVTGSTMDLVDLERVEVLRGPQGTLFGINTMGGAMRLISKGPRGDGSGSLDVTYGSRSRIDVKGSGDFALVPEKLLVRVTGVAKRQDGYGNRRDFTCDMIRRGTPQYAGIGDGRGANGAAVTPGSAADVYFPSALDARQGNDCSLGKLGGSESLGGRLQLRYIASDVLEFNVNGDYSTQTADPSLETQINARSDNNALNGATNTIGRAYQAEALRKYGLNIGQLEQYMVSPDPYTNYATYSDAVSGVAYDPNTHLKSWGLAGTADYDIAEKVHLKLISGYRAYRTTWMSDSDLTPFALLQTPYLQSHHQVQAEAQLTGLAYEDRIDWTLGAFHYHGHSRGYNWLYSASSNLAQLSDDIYTTSNLSGFGHVNFKLTDRLAVSAGLRYSDEDKTNLFRHYGNIVRPDPYRFGSTHTSYKAGLDFQATDNLFLYTSVSDGFTSAGVTPRIFSAEQLQQLSGEQVTNYEVGAKVELFDRRLRVNSAVFYMDYKKRLTLVFARECAIPNNGIDPGDPVFGLAPTALCPAGTPAAGTPGLTWFYYQQAPGTTKGFETEITYNPLAGLSLNAAVGYNKFEGDQKDTTRPNYRDPSALLQPKWNVNAGAQYAIRLGDAGALTPRLDWSYQSHRTNGSANLPQRDPDDINPGYGLLNARLTYASSEGDWQVALAALNLTDKFYWQNLGAATTRVPGQPLVSGAPAAGRVGTPGRPREWSLTVSKKFH
jgi:iron complex outermembrane recepter protein